MPKPKAKPKEPEVLKPLSQEEYEAAYRDLCHFSFKTVNSNVTEGGIRLSAETARLRMPYVAVRSLMAAGQDIPLDYLKNTGSTATAVKHWRVMQRSDEAEAVTNGDEINRIYRAVTVDPREIGTDTVPERLRQILVRKDDTYVSLTPLTAAGLMDRLQTALEPYRPGKQAPKRFPKVRQAFVGLGGSNPQNVGSLVRGMQRPLFFTSPQEKPEIRKAYGIYYRGASLDMPKTAMEEYRNWRVPLMVKNGGEMPTSFRIRAEETEIQLGILRRVFYRVEKLREFMEQHRELTPDGRLVSPNLPKLQQGLFDREFREGSWKVELARALADRLSLHVFNDGVAFHLSEEARAHLADLAKEHMPWK